MDETEQGLTEEQFWSSYFTDSVIFIGLINIKKEHYRYNKK